MFWFFFPQIKGLVPTLKASAGAPSAAGSVCLATWPALHLCLTVKFVSTWACRSCSAAPTRWLSSVTSVRRTLRPVFGWVWSSGAQKEKMTALWADAVISAADLATGFWFGPAASPTEESTLPNC